MFGRRQREKYCLVLSGGGAKGVYHLGAWKALREMGIEVEAFIGNSIGAVVAGFLAQGLTRELEEIGDHIGADFIMKIPEEFLENGAVTIKKANLSAFREFYHSVIEKKGIDVTPMRELLYNHLSEDSIRSSGNELGVVTFNVSDFKPQYRFLEDMPEGSVLDYLMASAAFPGLEQTVIKGKSFIDGGVVDNMPYQMALARGYKNIIVVDISGMGINKKPNVTGTRTVYIKNSINMGWVFDFSRPFLDKFRTLGYLDTKKVFGLLRGEKFFLHPDRTLEKAFSNYVLSGPARSILDYHLYEFLSDKERDEMTVHQKIRRLLPESLRQRKDLLYCLADCAAFIFRVEQIREYTLRELSEEIRKKKSIDDRKIGQLREGITQDERISLGKNLEIIFKEVRKKDRQNSPYYDYCLCTEVLDWGRKIMTKGLLVHHRELAAGLLAADFLSDYIS